MKLCLVTYDLNDKSSDYSEVVNKIESNRNKKIMKNVWILWTNKSPSEVLKSIKRETSKKDSVIVCEITKDSAWSLDDDAGSWLKACQAIQK